MSEPDALPSPAAPEAGLSLRQARERAGLHVAALAATLKVPARQLEALEAGRLHELPDATFARALAASVCRVLKLDPAPYLAALPLPSPVRLGEPEAALNTPLPATAAATSLRPTAAPASGLGLPVTLALGLLLLALTLWFVLPQRSPAPEPAVPPLPAAAPSPDAPASLVAPAPAPPTPPAAPVAPAAAAAAPTAPTAPAANAPLASAATADTPPVVSATPTPPTLQLSAQQTAWVQVTGASGRVWLQRSLQPGESVTFDADWPLQLVVGRVDAVQATLQGQALDLTPHSRNNVARLQVRPSP